MYLISGFLLGSEAVMAKLDTADDHFTAQKLGVGELNKVNVLPDRVQPIKSRLSGL